jgi:UDP-glucose 4-epimerase
MRKVALIGGNGFLGFHIRNLLLQMGIQPIVLDSGPPKESPKGVVYIHASVADLESVNKAIDGADAVVHLQSSILPSHGNDLNSPAIAQHLNALELLLSAMQKQGLSKIMFFSSGGAIYGSPKLTPTPESASLLPINTYGQSKKMSENLIQSFVPLGFSPLILRPSNVYGLGQGHVHNNGLINTLFHAAINSESVRIYGKGEVVRDYLNVDDLIRFVHRALTHWAPGTYNIGSSMGNSVSEVFALAEKTVGKEIKKVFLPKRMEDPQKIILNCEKALQIFGWQAQIDLEAGMADLWRKLNKERT